MDTGPVLSPERRRELLSRTVQAEVVKGGRIESQSEYSAVIVFGHRVNHVLHLILSIVTLGLWLIVWIILSLTGGEKRTLVSVDEFGVVNVQRVSGGFTPLMLIPIAILIVFLFALFSRAPTPTANQPSTAASAVGGGSVSSSGPSQSTPALQLQAAPPVSFAGATDKKTTAFTIGSPLRIAYTFAGDGNFIVSLNGADGSPLASLANRIGPGSATTWVYGGSGTGYFDVTANGAWTIKATAVLPKVAALPVTLKGDTDQVTAPFNSPGTLTVKWTFTGTGNFIVQLIDPTDGSPADSVANLIGKSTDSTQLYGHTGPFAFDVTADGPWRLAVTSSP
jgi:hypothetical protein